MHKVKLIAATRFAEGVMDELALEEANFSLADTVKGSEIERLTIYIARVSNPKNQANPNITKLLNTCVREGHVSVFEHGYFTMGITTSTAITKQILRHRSFTFQEFSQRYSDPTEFGFEDIEWRMQAEKNRQSSLDIAEPELDAKLRDAWEDILYQIKWLYGVALENGIARECARFILPQATRSSMYMTGNLRSWIHYIQSRTHESTQLEHRLIAEDCKKIFINECPIISEALGWI